MAYDVRISDWRSDVFSSELTASRVVDTALQESLPDTLSDPSMQLSVDNHRIDHPPEIVDRGIALDTDDPGFGVDHNLANVAAVGIGALTWQIVNALIDADIGTGHRPGIGEGSPHHLYHGQAQICATHRKPSFLVADIRRRRLKQSCSNVAEPAARLF